MICAASISLMGRSVGETAADRQWLAYVICGGDPVSMPFADAGEAVAAAQSEGVLTLVANRLSFRPIGDSLRTAFATAARQLTVVAMLREAECRRMLAVLQEAEIPVLLLKGSALAWWLYSAPHLRECSDIDLLLASREAVTRASRLMIEHGYNAGYEQGEHAYELVCRRILSGSLQLDLDLHWALNNAPVFATALSYDELFAASIPLDTLGPHARGLSPPHALLHAAMHRAINLYTRVGDSLKWLYDLHLLAEHLTPSEWSVVLQLCRQRGLGGVCVAGLDATAAVFGQAVSDEVMAELRATRSGEAVDGDRLHDWRYMHRMNLTALPSLKAKASWLWRKSFPSLQLMREMYGVNHGLSRLWLLRVTRILKKLR